LCSKRSLFILLRPLNPYAWRFRSKAFSSARPFPFGDFLSFLLLGHSAQRGERLYQRRRGDYI
jgi:hypothetical protein